MRRKLTSQLHLTRENARLRARLAEAEETLRAIRSGTVDALVVSGVGGDQVFTLKGADHPYRVLIEDINEGALTLTIDGVILYANRRFAEMLKTPLEKIIGSVMHTWIASADQKVFEALLRQDDTQTQHRGEVTLLASDGTFVPGYFSTNLLRNEDIRELFCLVATDLTEQKRNEAMVAAEKLARSILEQAAEAMVVCDEQGQIIRASEAAHGLCGQNPLGQLFDSAFPLQQGEGAAFSLAESVQAGSRRRAEVLLRRNGQMLNLLVSVGPLQGAQSEQLGSVISLIDITEHKRAEEVLSKTLNELLAHQIELQLQNEALQQAHRELGASRSKYFDLFEHAPVGYITLNVSRMILEVNLAAANLLDVPKHDLVAQPLMRFIAREDRDIHYLHQRRLVETRAPQAYELRVVRRDGGLRWVRIESKLEQHGDDPPVLWATLADITERKQRDRELEAVVRMSAALRKARTRAEMLPIIVDQITNLIPVESVALVANDERADVARTSQCLCPDVMEDIGAFVVIPLATHEAIIGSLAVASRTALSEEDVRVLTAISDIAASAIYRTALHEQTQRYAAAVTQAYDATLEGWAHALEMRDQETEGHTRRVVQLTLTLARALGIAEDDLEHIRRGALLHDIGKMGVPDSILLKPGPLDEREWGIMRRHPEYAYTFLSPIAYLQPALDIPYCHHEKWDGTGYPRGLKGEEIPLVARLFAIVDVWDALCSDRPYRRAWTRAQAREYLQAQSGKHFEPRIVGVFLQICDMEV